MKTGKRHIKKGNEFNHLFPKAEGQNETIKPVAGLDDTIRLMKHVTATTLEDTKALTPLLKASTQKQTLANIWQFCFDHLQYTKDEMGKEQVRRPSRVWQDRKKGVDCDCMSVFIGSILTNLGIPYSLRLTKYQSAEFEHVYPIAHTDNGSIILDAVVHRFNREVPYSSKKDIKMELQYLNGFEDSDFDEFKELDEIIENEYPIDAQGLIVDEDLEGLEGRAERLARKKARQEKRKKKKHSRPPLKDRIKTGLKKGLHAINKFNPATALLRAGVLASMKLNIMNVASKLRFAYWSDSEAARNNMNMSKFSQLKRIREKMEKIFFGAGGKPINLKKAILSGRGNRNQKVRLNGLGEVIHNVSDEDDLRTILGDDLYYDEIDDGGINGLGEPATGTAIAAASGVIATIAALLKNLGQLFKKGSPEAEQEVLQDNTAAREEKARKFSFKNLQKFVSKRPATIPQTVSNKSLVIPESYDTDVPDIDYSDQVMRKSGASTSDGGDADTEDQKDEKGFVGWIKKNKGLAIGIAATAVVGGTILAVRSSNKKKKALNGPPKKKSTSSSKAKASKPATKRKTSTKKATSKRKPTPKRKVTTRKRPTVKKVELL